MKCKILVTFLRVPHFLLPVEDALMAGSGFIEAWLGVLSFSYSRKFMGMSALQFPSLERDFQLWGASQGTSGQQEAIRRLLWAQSWSESKAIKSPI